MTHALTPPQSVPVIDNRGNIVDHRVVPWEAVQDRDFPAMTEDGTVVDIRTVTGALAPPGAEVPRCSDAGYGHDQQQCLACQRRRRWVQRQLDEEEAKRQTETTPWVDGTELFDLPEVSPLWGTAEELLAAEGQGWMIAGPDGTGKTSTAAEYVKARLGVPEWGGEVWGLPVRPLDPGLSVLYFAMDRPRQFAEAFMRGMRRESPEHVEAMRRLRVHKGPPGVALGHDAGQRWLLREVIENRAGLVVFDSRKDMGNTMDPADVAGVARAIQLLVASDVEVLVLAHTTKGGTPSLESVYGHREVFSGLGSVLVLEGRAGDARVRVHHVKPIREVVPPFTVARDAATGRAVRVEGIVESTGPSWAD